MINFRRKGTASALVRSFALASPRSDVSRFRCGAVGQPKAPLLVQATSKQSCGERGSDRNLVAIGGHLAPTFQTGKSPKVVRGS